VNRARQRTHTDCELPFEYEETDGQLAGSSYGPAAGFVTVTHDGGDSIDHRERYLRGTGFVDQSDWATSGSAGSSDVYADDYKPSDARVVTSTGQWPGVATSGDDSAVVSGDFVHVGVTSDYEIDVVYQSRTDQQSATLQSDSGPDA
jgi:hypothetical protein